MILLHRRNPLRTLVQKISCANRRKQTIQITQVLVPLIIKTTLNLHEKNQWSEGYFKFMESRASSSLNRIEYEPKKVSCTVESDVVKLSTKFPNVDLKDYGNAKGRYITFKSTM